MNKLIKRIQRMGFWHRTKNKIYMTMIKNNLLIFSAIFLSFIGGFIYFVYAVNVVLEREDYIVDKSYYFSASAILEDDYHDIDSTMIDKLGGWVEILDENYNLEYVLGTKKDKIKHYSASYFFRKIESNYKIHSYVIQDNIYYHSVEPFLYDNKIHYCVVKLPSKVIDVDVKVSNYDMKEILRRMVGPFVIISGWVFILFTVILGFAIIKSRNFIKPLISILEGIKKMDEGDYSYRMNFEAEHEFSEIRDAFNRLAERVSVAENEREKSELAKQQLMVDISHDIKTPATSVQGYAKAILDGVIVSEEQKHKYLMLIYKKTQRLSQLTDNLHTLSKLENPRYQVHLTTADFCEFLRVLLSEFYKEIEDKQFELIVDLPEKTVLCQIDTFEMHRAISNILKNALIYNPMGTKLWIELVERKDQIELLISDNGIGISDALKEKIFEPFVRGDESRKSTGGTGVGLSIAKKIIEKHGGSITLTERNDFCTCFRIIIKCERMDMTHK